MAMQVHGSHPSTLMGRLCLLLADSWQGSANWLCTEPDNGFSTRCGVRRCLELAAAMPLLLKLDACIWHCQAVLLIAGREAEQCCS